MKITTLLGPKIVETRQSKDSTQASKDQMTNKQLLEGWVNQNTLLKTTVHLGHSFKSRFQTFLVSSLKSTPPDFRTLREIILIKSDLGISCLCGLIKSLQPCSSLCTPLDCGLPGSSIHWILQARILEWVAISSSRGSPQPRDLTGLSYFFCTGRRILHH